jgi:hypothetical protein
MTEDWLGVVKRIFRENNAKKTNFKLSKGNKIYKKPNNENTSKNKNVAKKNRGSRKSNKGTRKNKQN